MAEFSVADELIKLKSLLDAGVLTQEEFEAQKSSLLSSTGSKENEQADDLEDLFEIKYVGYIFSKKHELIKAVRDLLGLDLAGGKAFVENPPKIVKARADSIYCKFAKGVIEKAGGKVEVTKVGSRKKEVYNRKTVRCPNCGSTSITSMPVKRLILSMVFIAPSKIDIELLERLHYTDCTRSPVVAAKSLACVLWSAIHARGFFHAIEKRRDEICLINALYTSGIAFLKAVLSNL